MEENLLDGFSPESSFLLNGSNSSNSIVSSPTAKNTPTESTSPKLKTKSRLGQSSVASSLSIESNSSSVANIKIRYITDEVLHRYLTRQASKQPQVTNNKKLTSSMLSHSGFHANQTIEQQFTDLDLTPEFKNEKFQTIENLDKFTNLVRLNLSDNCIIKIERLGNLVNLRELNLSNNCIQVIDGLEKCKNLEILNLSGNQIERLNNKNTIKNFEKLKAIKELYLHKNQICVLEDIKLLRLLSSLHKLSIIEENPVSKITHAKLYIVYYLNNLSYIDGVAISAQEKTDSRSRFEKVELDNLEKQVNTLEKEVKESNEQLNTRKSEILKYRQLLGDLQARVEQYESTLKKTEDEAGAKSVLLDKKSKDLQRALSFIYTLLQKLEFLKIDHPEIDFGFSSSKSEDVFAYIQQDDVESSEEAVTKLEKLDLRWVLLRNRLSHIHTRLEQNSEKKQFLLSQQSELSALERNTISAIIQKKQELSLDQENHIKFQENLREMEINAEKIQQNIIAKRNMLQQLSTQGKDNEELSLEIKQQENDLMLAQELILRERDEYKNFLTAKSAGMNNADQPQAIIDLKLLEQQLFEYEQEKAKTNGELFHIASTSSMLEEEKAKIMEEISQTMSERKEILPQISNGQFSVWSEVGSFLYSLSPSTELEQVQIENNVEIVENICKQKITDWFSASIELQQSPDKGEIDTLERELEASNRLINEKNSHISKVELENQALREKLTKLEQENNTVITEKIEIIKKQQADIYDLNLMIAERDSSILELQDRLTQKNAFELNEKDAQLRNLSDSLDKLTNELGVVKQENSTLREQSKDLQIDLEKLNSINDELEAAKQKLIHSFELVELQGDALIEEKLELEDTLTSYFEELQEAKETIFDLQRQLSEKEVEYGKSKQLSDELSSLKNESQGAIDELKRDFETTKQKIKAAESSLTVKDDLLLQLQEEKKEIQISMQLLTEEKESTRKQIQELKQIVTEKEVEALSYQDTILMHKKQVNELTEIFQKERDKLLSSIASSEKDCLSLSKQLSLNQEKEKQFESVILEKDKKNDQLAKQLQVEIEKSTELNEKIFELESELLNKDVMVRELKEELSSMENEMEKLKNEIEVFENGITALKTELENAQGKAEDYDKIMKEIRSQPDVGPSVPEEEFMDVVHQLKDMEEVISQKEQFLSQKDELIKNLQDVCNTKEEELKNQKSSNATMQQQLVELEKAYILASFNQKSDLLLIKDNQIARDAFPENFADVSKTLIQSLATLQNANIQISEKKDALNHIENELSLAAEKLKITNIELNNNTSKSNEVILDMKQKQEILSREIERLESSKVSLLDSISNLESIKIQTEAQIDQSRERFESQQQLLVTIEQALSTNQDTLSSIEGSIKSLQDQQALLLQEKDNIKKELELLQHEKKKLASANEDQSKSINLKQLEYQNLEYKKQDLITQIQVLESVLSAKQETSKIIENESQSFNEIMKATIHNLEDEKKDLVKEKILLETKVLELNQEKSRSFDAIEKLKNQELLLTKTLDEKRVQQSQMESKIAALENQKKVDEKRLMEIQSELASWTEALKRYQEKFAKVKQHELQIKDSLKTELQESSHYFENQLSILMSENTKLKDTIYTLMKRHSAVRNEEMKIDSLPKTKQEVLHILALFSRQNKEYKFEIECLLQIQQDMLGLTKTTPIEDNLFKHYQSQSESLFSLYEKEFKRLCGKLVAESENYKKQIAFLQKSAAEKETHLIKQANELQNQFTKLEESYLKQIERLTSTRDIPSDKNQEFKPILREELSKMHLDMKQQFLRLQSQQVDNFKWKKLTVTLQEKEEEVNHLTSQIEHYKQTLAHVENLHQSDIKEIELLAKKCFILEQDLEKKKLHTEEIDSKKHAQRRDVCVQCATFEETSTYFPVYMEKFTRNEQRDSTTILSTVTDSNPPILASPITEMQIKKARTPVERITILLKWVKLTKDILNIFTTLHQDINEDRTILSDTRKKKLKFLLKNIVKATQAPTTPASQNQPSSKDLKSYVQVISNERKNLETKFRHKSGNEIKAEYDLLLDKCEKLMQKLVEHHTFLQEVKDEV